MRPSLQTAVKKLSQPEEEWGLIVHEVVFTENMHNKNNCCQNFTILMPSALFMFSE
jgi:hypothetical protein